MKLGFGEYFVLNSCFELPYDFLNLSELLLNDIFGYLPWQKNPFQC